MTSESLNSINKPPGEGSDVLLVTGFGPFENHDLNPSGEIAELVDGRVLHGVRVVGRRVPVSWRKAWDAIQNLASEYQPRALLCLGVAPTPFFRMEVLAKNIALPYDKDADGETPEAHGDHYQIVMDAPPAYTTLLPVAWLESRLDERHAMLTAGCDENNKKRVVQGGRWHDAGCYLCNYVFYLAMHYLTDIPVRGFVHVPPFPDNESKPEQEKEDGRTGEKEDDKTESGDAEVKKNPVISRAEILGCGKFVVDQLVSHLTGLRHD